MPPLVPAALAVVYVGWGATYLGIRLMVETIPPFLGAGTRYLAAGTLMLAALGLRRGVASVARVTPRQLGALLVVATLLLAGGNGLVTLGEQEVPAGLAALVVASEPLWIVVLRGVLGERVPGPAILAVLVGFAGVALLLLPGGQPGDATIGGLLVIVAAALSWAVGSIAGGRLPGLADAFVATGWQMVLGGLVLVALSLATGELAGFDPGAVSARSLAGWAFLVGPGSLLAFSAYVWLLRNAPIGLVSTYAFVNPVVAVALGAMLLDEEITGAMAIGAAIIVGSVALVIAQETRAAATVRDDAQA
ncbi:MAG TPA: EamA family transporter [Capillimicrobium sp.]|nr:EamA family transporter [Capillimicrobium sp.]